MLRFVAITTNGIFLTWWFWVSLEQLLDRYTDLDDLLFISFGFITSGSALFAILLNKQANDDSLFNLWIAVRKKKLRDQLEKNGD